MPTATHLLNLQAAQTALVSLVITQPPPPPPFRLQRPLGDTLNTRKKLTQVWQAGGPLDRMSTLSPHTEHSNGALDSFKLDENAGALVGIT